MHPDVRIGTAEREQAVELLTRHLGEGRLSLAEFGDRCAQVEVARTYRDLAALFADLPLPASPPPRRRVLWILLPITLIGLYAGFAAADLVAWFVPAALAVTAGAAVVYLATRRRRRSVPEFLRAAPASLPEASRAPFSRFGLVPYALVLLAPALLLRQPVVVLAAVGFLIFAVVRGID